MPLVVRLMPPHPVDDGLVHLKQLQSYRWPLSEVVHHLRLTQVATAQSAMWHHRPGKDLSLLLLKSRKKTNVPFVTVNCHLEILITSRLFAKLTSPRALPHTALTGHLGAAEQVMNHHLLRGGQACIRIQQRRRTASTKRSVPFVLRSLRLGFLWRG